jgi:hypothetical protein
MTIERLIDIPVPPMYESQLERFTLESIHAQFVQNFDGESAVERLSTMEDEKVIGADFGGDKVITTLLKLSAVCFRQIVNTETMCRVITVRAI